MDETGGSGGLIWSSSDEMDGVLPPHNLYTETGSPWENGQIESFNGKLRGEILNPGDVRHGAKGESAGRKVEAALQCSPPS